MCMCAFALCIHIIAVLNRSTLFALNVTLIVADVLFQDTFFYSLVYDPQQKTLLADKGEIRVGSKFQAEITALLKEGESPSCSYFFKV